MMEIYPEDFRATPALAKDMLEAVNDMSYDFILAFAPSDNFASVLDQIVYA